MNWRKKDMNKDNILGCLFNTTLNIFISSFIYFYISHKVDNVV